MMWRKPMIETMTKPEAPIQSGGEIVVTADRPDGIIRLACRGFVTADQVDESLVALGLLFQKRDACGQPVLVLVDNRRMSIQTAETADRIGVGVRKHHRPHHRVAIVLASKLAAMQLRRVTLEQGPTIFDDEEEAVNWLLVKG